MIMTTKFRAVRKILVSLMLGSLCIPRIFPADDTTWTIAAQKFSLARGQKESAVFDSIAENLPAAILEKIARNQSRSVLPPESLERIRYDLRAERQSLFLQLSGEHKKRDSLFMGDYSQRRLEAKLKEADKKIAEIQKKISANLERQRKAEEDEAEQSRNVELSGSDGQNDSGLRKFASLLGNMIVNERPYISSEKITLYKDDFTALYKPSDGAAQAGYESQLFAKEVYTAGINALLIGTFSIYGDYLAVNASLYLYPGAECIGTVMEVGDVQDLEMIAAGIAGQIAPLITNALPVTLSVSVLPKEITPMVYVDSRLVMDGLDNLKLNSGRHSLLVSAEGYETVSINELFSGNTDYQIEITMHELENPEIQVGLAEPVLGGLFLSGEPMVQTSPQKYIVQLNGSRALGEFIAADGGTAFFYIPQNLLADGAAVRIRPKAINRSEYLDKRRRWAYGSYSVFVLSLIPAFYTYGNFLNQVHLHNDLGTVTYDEAIRWQNAAYTCIGISVACGIFWGVELVRYFLAANASLPEKARAGDVIDFAAPGVISDDNIANIAENIFENGDLE